MSWAEIKKAVNDNFSYPLNKQRYIYKRFEFTDSTTFTVPQTGTYIVTCVGKGGDGGDAISSSSAPNGCGGSGGSGGIAQSKLTLTKNASIAITVSNTISSFGSYLSAHAGGNGEYGYQSTGAGGTAGTATGGNLLNLAGIAGATGTGDSALGASTRKVSPNTINYVSDARRGGNGYNPTDFIAVGGNTSETGTPGYAGAGCATPDAGGGAPGAGGGGAFSSSRTEAYGGIGGSGMVVVEFYLEIFG